MNSEKLKYRISGKGKNTVLFLHGWGGSMQSFQFFEQNLNQYNLVINCDLYGFGESKIEYEKISDIYFFALNIYLFLKKNNINNLSIVAHSFGGRIAIILASCFDLKINYLVLTGCAGIKIKKKIKVSAKIFIYKLIKKLKLSNFKFFNAQLFGSSDYNKLTNNGKIFFNKILSQDLTYLLKYINSKCYLFWGEKDNSTPVKIAYIMQKKLHNCKLVVFNNSGHFCYLENKIQFLNVLNNI